VTAVENEELVFLDLDFEVPCEIKGCEPRIAEWKCVTICCGWLILMCDPHLQEWKRYSSEGGGWICNNCKTALVGNPFKITERLE
jgi:hypothetical protein